MTVDNIFALGDLGRELGAVKRSGPVPELWVQAHGLTAELRAALVRRGAVLVERGSGQLSIAPPVAALGGDLASFWTALPKPHADALGAAWDGSKLGDMRFAKQHADGSPVVMGILNTTPDSFSDGGAHASVEAAIQRGRELLDQGATWIDVGGESTRPGAEEVHPDEECARVLPVIEALAGMGARVSIDTRKSGVAEAALGAGAELVNDVSGGLFDPQILAVAAAANAGYCAMHMRGTPATMQGLANYDAAALEVAAALRERASAAVEAGIAPERLWLDPGIGFAKALDHNLAVLAELDVLASLGFPLLVGLSRKKMIGQLTGVQEPKLRLSGSLAGLSLAAANGAHILRVHDVGPSCEALAVAAALCGRAAN
jgi:dihydropteroate synthase